MGYEDKHRIFLQGIMTRGIINVEEVKKLYEIAHKRCGSKRQFCFVNS